MKSIQKIVNHCFILIFGLALISNPVFAGELKPAGSKLEKDSMVFSVEEAQKMAQYISELENKVEQQNELIEAKDELLKNRAEQIITFEEYQKIQNNRILKYQEIVALDEKRIAALEKQNKGRKLETAAAFVGGVVVTVGLIIIADKIDDHIIDTYTSFQTNAMKATRPIVRF